MADGVRHDGVAPGLAGVGRLVPSGPLWLRLGCGRHVVRRGTRASALLGPLLRAQIAFEFGKRIVNNPSPQDRSVGFVKGDQAVVLPARPVRVTLTRRAWNDPLPRPARAVDMQRQEAMETRQPVGREGRGRSVARSWSVHSVGAFLASTWLRWSLAHSVSPSGARHP